MTTPANAVMRRDYNHSGFVTASDRAFAEAHGMGAHAWPMPPSTEPYRIWVRYEIPPDCTFRAVVTGAADLVTISNVVAQTDGDEAFFALPSGSGTLEIEIDANGADTNGCIRLEMTTPSGDTYGFDGQAFETISSIFEKKTQFAMKGEEERTPFRLHPALAGFTADWELVSQGGDYPQFFPTRTGGTAVNAITDASEVWVSAGMNPGAFPVYVALRGYHNREDAALQVFSMVFEPITSETNALGKTVNPSCVVVRRSGYFKATVSSNVSNEDIHWSASSESAGLQTQSGPMAEVRPTACGTNTLWVQVGDYERVRGVITFLAVEETTTEIRAYILGTTNGFPRTAAEVMNYVTKVNRIYEQVGMKFTLCSVTNITKDEEELRFNNPDGNLILSNICSIATNTGGLEVYFVPDTGRGNVLAFNYAPGGRGVGIVAGPATGDEALAHEIGHSCGLSDIYVNKDALRSLMPPRGSARLAGPDRACPRTGKFSRRQWKHLARHFLLQRQEKTRDHHKQPADDGCPVGPPRNRHPLWHHFRELVHLEQRAKGFPHVTGARGRHNGIQPPSPP